MIEARNSSWLALTSLVLVLGGCCHPKDVLPRSTPGFWGPDDFTGSYDSAAKEPAINTQTTWNGDIVFTNLPRSVVSNVLPADLQLAANVGDMPGQHPVVLMFGVQTNLRWVVPPIPAGNPYNEMILLIPFVQKVGGQKWHDYVVRMYLDWQMGVDGGNLLYGYRKELGTLVQSASLTQPPEFIYKVTQGNAPRLTAQVTGQSAWMSDAAAKTALANYEDMKTIFGMPILGTWPASYATASPYVCSYFVFQWDAVSVRSASTSFQFESNFVPNMDPWVAAGTLYNLKNGDFGVTGLSWQLTSPKTCDF